MQELDYNHLTRRPDEHRPDCWRIHCGDICCGWIALATTINGQSEWQWRVAMYPGSRPGEGYGGSASTYDEAKAAFKIAWLKFAHSRTPEDFEAYRDQQQWTARKYALRDAGKEIPVR